MIHRSVILIFLGLAGLPAHEAHSDRTYEIKAPANPSPDERAIALEIRDRTTGERLPARFSIEIDGEKWTPVSLNEHGIHFTSVHARKKQRETVLYSRGTGPVCFAISEDIAKVKVHVSRGLQFRPATIEIEVGEGTTAESVDLERFIDLTAEDWHAADEHLHYERRDPKHDADWLAMLDADGLNQGFFMVLKGGNFDDVWAQQYGYGEAGEGRNERQLLISGEEFRGSMQGHNNLLGHSELFEPISVGGMGKPPHPFNAPSTHDVLVRTRKLGGIGGPAHGGTFGRASTAVLDALSGASDFFELANTHLLELGPWYRVMNCGVILPPAAGTDLPNFPYRDSWQPFFGETRMFVRSENSNDFASWKEAVRAGRVFVSSGPLLTKFKINGVRLGESVQLPAGGGEVEIEAEVVSPRQLSALELICNGEALKIGVVRSTERGINRWTVRRRIQIAESCWFAVRAFGPRKVRLFAEGKQLQKTMMHSAAIPVLVNDNSIRVAADVEDASDELRRFRERYQTEGKFPDEETRNAMVELFDRVIATLNPDS